MQKQQRFCVCVCERESGEGEKGKTPEETRNQEK